VFVTDEKIRTAQPRLPWIDKPTDVLSFQGDGAVIWVNILISLKLHIIKPQSSTLSFETNVRPSRLLDCALMGYDQKPIGGDEGIDVDCGEGSDLTERNFSLRLFGWRCHDVDYRRRLRRCEKFSVRRLSVSMDRQKPRPRFAALLDHACRGTDGPSKDHSAFLVSGAVLLFAYWSACPFFFPYTASWSLPRW